MRFILCAIVLTGGCADLLGFEHVDPPPADPCGAAPTSGSIRVAGQMHDATNDTPIAGLSVDATPGGVSPTDTNGAFSIDVPTNNDLVFLTLTASGVPAFPTHAIHYQRALTSGMDASSKLLPPSALESLYDGPAPATTGTALVSLRDCAGNGIADATVTVDGAAAVVYQGGGTATNGTGVAYALGVAPGTITVEPSTGRAFMYEARSGEVALLYLATP